MRPHVFISYAREDAAFVSALAVRLSSDYVVWWDADLVGGEDFEKRILEIIPASGVVICIVSRASSASEWVKKEVDAAVARNVPVIPVAIDDAELPAAFANRNVLFIDRPALDAGGDVVNRLMRDVAAYLATAKASEESEVHAVKIRGRWAMRKLLALLAALGALAWLVAQVAVPLTLAIVEEDRQAKAEAAKEARDAELGILLTKEQADWMNGALGDCDVVRITTPAFSRQIGGDGATYGGFVRAGPAALANTPRLAEHCRAEYGASGAASDLCVWSIRYIRVHEESLFSVHEGLTRIEAGGPEPSAASGAGDAPFDACAAARKVEGFLNPNPFRTLETTAIPEVRRVAACLRESPFSVAGLTAQENGTFRSIEDRLLDAGCIAPDLPATAIGLGASLPMIVEQTVFEREERNRFARLPADKHAVDRTLEAFKAYGAEQKNAAGAIRVFSDDATQKRVGFRLLSEAAAAGHLPARANKGLCQLLGVGTTVDPSAGSANIRAAVQGGLSLEGVSWAWKDSLSTFKVGDVSLLIKTLELRARTGDPVFKAFLGVLNSQGVGACQPACIDAARRLAGELKAAGHAQWAGLVANAADAAESARPASASTVSPAFRLRSEAAPTAKWKPSTNLKAGKPPFWIRVFRKLKWIR